jgi:hypothetical protein
MRDSDYNGSNDSNKPLPGGVARIVGKIGERKAAQSGGSIPILSLTAP